MHGGTVDASTTNGDDIADTSDALHRQLAAGSGRCWILLDPCARALEQHEALLQSLAKAPTFGLTSNHPDLDASLLPVLYGIDTTQATGSEALRASLAAAAVELTPPSLSTGNGRAICGWLCCDLAFDDAAAQRLLSLHLSQLCVQRKPDGRAALLRWFDPAVIWALWSLLRPAQQVALLGPIQSFWMLDPAGALMQLGTESNQAMTAPLGLNAEQWRDVDHIGALNGALLECVMNNETLPPLKDAPSIALKALRRAHTLGFTDAADLSAFARLALSVHPEFDTHPQVRERLARRQTGDFFTALVDDMTPDTWQTVRAECQGTVTT